MSPGRPARRDAASSVAPIEGTIETPCVLASHHAAHPVDGRHHETSSGAMRILHVIQEMRTGGAERVVASLVVGARGAGHESAVASAGGPLLDGLPAERFDLRLVRGRPWVVPGNALALRHAIRAWRPDVVHAHNPGMALVAALATRPGRRPPAIVSVHGVPEEDWPATARVLRIAGLDAVACGPGVEAALEGRVLATIPNGVSPAPPPAQLEWPAPVILAVGRLVEQKNHALAIRALADVPGATLVIAGEGPLRDELEREAREAGVADRVVLAGLRPDVRALMGGADAIVMPSHWEGLPLTALEARASGTPIVATAVRGLRELLADGREALLVPPGDAPALAAALRRLLDDRELATRLGDEGRRLAEGDSEERMVAAYLALYDKIRR